MAIETWIETDADHGLHRHTVLTCDECENKVEELYQYDGVDLCLHCFVNLLLDTADYTLIKAE